MARMVSRYGSAAGRTFMVSPPKENTMKNILRLALPSFVVGLSVIACAAAPESEPETAPTEEVASTEEALESCVIRVVDSKRCTTCGSLKLQAAKVCAAEKRRLTGGTCLADGCKGGLVGAMKI